MTHEEKTRKIINSQVKEDLSCNQIEADTRSILEASKSKHLVVLRASDTDVFVLMYLSANVSRGGLVNEDWQWYFKILKVQKIDSSKYASKSDVTDDGDADDDDDDYILK